MAFQINYVHFRHFSTQSREFDIFNWGKSLYESNRLFVKPAADSLNDTQLVGAGHSQLILIVIIFAIKCGNNVKDCVILHLEMKMNWKSTSTLPMQSHSFCVCVRNYEGIDLYALVQRFNFHWVLYFFKALCSISGSHSFGHCRYQPKYTWVIAR